MQKKPLDSHKTNIDCHGRAGAENQRKRGTARVIIFTVSFPSRGGWQLTVAKDECN